MFAKSYKRVGGLEPPPTGAEHQFGIGIWCSERAGAHKPPKTGWGNMQLENTDVLTY